MEDRAMDLSNWVELLFKYGPYAVLALFALWVAPRQTRQFIECKARDQGTRYLCGGVAIGSWSIVVLMVAFVYGAWSPRTVYTGSLGTHGDDVQFIPIHREFYISTQPRPDGRLTWNYAIVAELGNENEPYEFTYVWGAGEAEYTDYAIAPELLKQGPLRLAAGKGDRSVLLYDDDRDPQTPAQPFPVIARAHTAPKGFSTWMAAYAAEPAGQEWVRALDSKNPYFQAQGRSHLRKLSNNELRAAMRTDGLSKRARRSMSKEMKRRE